MKNGDDGRPLWVQLNKGRGHEEGPRYSLTVLNDSYRPDYSKQPSLCKHTYEFTVKRSKTIDSLLTELNDRRDALVTSTSFTVEEQATKYQYHGDLFLVQDDGPTLRLRLEMEAAERRMIE
ncbi:MAG: hypothetical protein OXI79_08920 [Gammaproteobacteria bacterium]|nr:hypothetical protein [Gammaproteobacteria bacterium]